MAANIHPHAGPGRKPKDMNRANTQLTLSESSPKAAGLLRDHLDGRAKLDTTTVDICKYIINQDLGLPKARTELTGAGGPVEIVVSYGKQVTEQTQEPLDNTPIQSYNGDPVL